MIVATFLAWKVATCFVDAEKSQRSPDGRCRAPCVRTIKIDSCYPCPCDWGRMPGMGALMRNCRLKVRKPRSTIAPSSMSMTQ